MGMTITQDGKRYNPCEFAEKRKQSIELLTTRLTHVTCADDLNILISDARKDGMFLRNHNGTEVKEVKEDFTNGSDLPALFYYVNRPRSSRRSITLDTMAMTFTIS